MDIKTIGHQKSIGMQLLHTVKQHLKAEPYLAGGMLRDHYFNNLGNDYDIYVEYDPNFDYETFMVPLLNGIEGFENFDLMKAKTDYSYSGKMIHAVYEGSYYPGNYPVQIIVTKEHPRVYIEEIFCCTLSKVWQTAGMQPVYHQEFLDSVNDKILQFDFSNFDSINFNYIEKIANRFSDFRLDANTESLFLDKKVKYSYWR